MARTVFILGAGASKAGGAPLMGEFLDVAEDCHRLARLAENDREHFGRVFKALGLLYQVHSKMGALDLVNIESVFGIVEMARVLGRFPGLADEQIIELSKSMVWLIVRTLEHTLSYPVQDGSMLAPPPYGQFVELIANLRRYAEPRHSVAVLTFNYDIGIDFALRRQFKRPIFYGLPNQVQADRDIPLLKLHGSINWLVEKHESSPAPKIFPWDIGEAIESSGMLSSPASSRVLLPLDFTKAPDSCDVTDGPVIVPPTWSKGEYHRQLSSVWARAARELEEAENIFVIGYSLPPTDGFFPLLYGLGTVGETRLRRFWVFNPDPKVGCRFKRMLGPGARQRFRAFSTTTQGARSIEVPFRFSDAITRIQQEFPALQR